MEAYATFQLKNYKILHVFLKLGILQVTIKCWFGWPSFLCHIVEDLSILQEFTYVGTELETKQETELDSMK